MRDSDLNLLQIRVSDEEMVLVAILVYLKCITLYAFSERNENVKLNP